MNTNPLSIKTFSKIRRGARAWNKLFQRHESGTPEYFADRDKVFRTHGLDGIESLFWDRKNNLHLINYYAQNVQYYGICVAEKLLLRQVNSLCNSMITDIHIAQQLKYLLCQMREANKCAFYSLEFSGDPLIGHMTMLETKLNQIFNRADFYTLVPRKKYRTSDEKFSTPTNHEFGIPLESSKHLENFYSYCETNFARMALALLKFNCHQESGELECVPLVDFSRTYTDQELYTMAGFTQEEITVIESLLPDYYNRRK